MIPPETPPLTEAELAELPVFPLPNAVLFPGVTMGLHLFEPRYRAMMRHCLDHGPRAIAIARLRPGFERDYEGQPPIFEVAGAGRIVAHRGNADGTFDLLLEGTDRVRLVELPFEPPFRRARAAPIADVMDDPALVDGLRRALESGDVAKLVAAYERGSEAPVPPPELRGSAGRVADLLIDRVVRDPDARQKLLETADVGARYTALASLLVDRTAARARESDRWKKAN
jgi:ATP-dependent Lon protease